MNKALRDRRFQLRCWYRDVGPKGTRVLQSWGVLTKAEGMNRIVARRLIRVSNGLLCISSRHLRENPAVMADWLKLPPCLMHGQEAELFYRAAFKHMQVSRDAQASEGGGG